MKGIFGRIIRKLLHNWGLKLASIFLAFVIWFIVVQVGDPKDTRPYANIRVKLVNTELLDDQNKFYEVLDNSDSVKVNVTAPTSVFQTLRASDIVAEADVSKLTDINTIAITYYAINTNAEVIAFEGDHDMVRLNVEDKVSKWISVSYQAVGTVSDGYVIGSTTADQTFIYITGPKSQIDQVVSAYAELNVDGVTTNSSANVELRLRDRDNRFVELNNIEMNMDHVLVSVEVLATKEVPVVAGIVGTPADGYVVVGDAQQDVETVMIAGTIGNLAKISRIVIPSDRLDVTGATEDKTFNVNLKDFLPDNIKFADNDFGGRVNITVTIKASRERVMEVSLRNVSLVNVPAGYEAVLVEEEDGISPVTLRVFGLRDTINALRAASIYGTVDVGQWMAAEGITELRPGTYEIPVTFVLGDDVTVLEAGTVRVEISELEQ